MAKLEFQFFPKDTNPLSQPRGFILLAAHGIGNKGEHHLSAECVTAREVEAAANFLKAQLDEIVSEAREKFAN
jgi:hypothetical protein